MKLSIKIPADLKKTLLRLSLVLTILTLIRVLFLIFNWSSFPKADFFSFVIGVWFDMITLSLFMFPVIILTLVPSGKSLIQRSLEKISNIYFHLISILLYMLNLMDIEYFKYTSKRSTIDLFTVLGAGNDFKQLITTFITDFWLIFLTLFIFIIVHFKINKIITKRIANKQKSTFKNHILFTLLSIAIFIVIGRGGFQLKPVGIIEAAQYTSPNNSTLVLNTGFTMMKSYGKQGLEPIEYFKNNDEFKFFYPIKHTEAQHILPNKTNLVIIILESFGAEFIGAYNKNVSYTPFLDSLIKESLSFEYAYANGKKSIEAVPSIISSIPSLMDNPYISSPYSDNSENGLAKILKENGYSTAFFHGATNGSMRFDSYAALAGFDNYFGRKEYGNDEHFDQTWGISDEYFNPWTAKKLSTLKAPFFGTLFTISSHHPYYIPPNYKDKVKRGSQPICASINYGDHALRLFFNEAKKQKWYKNTLFVLVADHTPASTTAEYNQKTMMYRIPILFFDPGNRLPKEMIAEIFQQIDIMPTSLDLLNIDTKFYAFGNSLYDKKSPREALTYIEGSYYYFRKNYMFTFQHPKNFKTHELYKIKNSSKEISLSKDKELYLYQCRLKSMIQQYNHDLMNNQTIVK